MGFLNVEQVILQPLTLTIDGTADKQINQQTMSAWYWQMAAR